MTRQSNQILQLRDPKFTRRYMRIHPDIRVMEIHDHDCPCCQPYGPGVEQRLSPRELGMWMVAGIVVGNLIAFAIDPAGAARALLAAVGL